MTQKNKDILKLIASVFIFGTIGIVRAFIPAPSAFIACVRGLSGAAFLLIFMLCTKHKPDFSAIKKNLAMLCTSGALIGANWVCLFEAYRYTTVSTATMCYYMAPVFMIFIARVVLKEKAGAKKLICAALALLGMALVSGIFGSADFSAAGVLFGLAAAVMYAVVILLNKLLKDISAYDRTVVQLAAAGAAVLPHTLIAEDISEAEFSLPVILLLLTAGIIHTGLAYALYFGSVKQLPAQTVAIFSYIDPAVAVILSVFVLGEEFSLTKAIGAVLVIGAAAASEISFAKKEE